MLVLVTASITDGSWYFLITAFLSDGSGCFFGNSIHE